MSYDGSLTVLSAADVDAALASLGPEALVESQERVFKAYSASRAAAAAQDAVGAEVQQPQRVTLYLPSGRSLYMPSYARGLGSACKTLTRQKGGMRASTTLLTKEGEVEGVLNAERLTALRNAAGSALFYRFCGSTSTPRVLVVFGAGLQARGHVQFFLRLWPSIAQVDVIARRETERAKALISDMRTEFPRVAINLLVSDDAHDEGVMAAVWQADMVVTTTAATEPLFPSEAVDCGAAVMLIGSCTRDMCEAEPELLARAGTVVVDTVDGCLAEAGEIVCAGLKADDLVEIGTLAEGKRKVGGKRKFGDDHDVAVFKSVGMGVQDLAISRLVFDEARRLGLGTRVDGFAAPAAV